jgi:hypothetical protein
MGERERGKGIREKRLSLFLWSTSYSFINKVYRRRRKKQCYSWISIFILSIL